MSQIPFVINVYQDTSTSPTTYVAVVLGSPTTQPVAQTRLISSPMQTSMRDNAAIITITNATNAAPIAITTSAAHGLSTGNFVTQQNVGGNTAANGTFRITVTGATSYTLDGSSGNAAYTSGGIANQILGTPYMPNAVQSAFNAAKDYFSLP